MKHTPTLLLYFFLFLLPTQLGIHFWPDFSIVLGRRVDYLSPTLYLSDIVLFLLALLTLVFYKDKPVPKSMLFFLIGILIIGCISWWVSEIKLLSIYGTLRYLEIWLFSWVLIKLTPSRRGILLILSLSVCFTSLLSILQFLNQKSVGGVWRWLGERTFTANTPGIAQVIVPNQLLLRPYATLPHPNVLGGFMSILLPLILFATVHKDDWLWYVLRLSSICFMVLSIFISLSRGAWFATVMILVSWVWQKFPGRRILKIGIPAILTTLLFIEEILIGRLASIFFLDTASAFERKQLVEIALKLFADAPLLGVGILQFIPHIPLVSSPPYLLQPVHSQYILILTENGIFGVGLFLILYLKALSQAKRTWQGLFLGILVLGFLGSFDHYFITLIQGQRLLALVIGLAFSTRNKEFSSN